MDTKGQMYLSCFVSEHFEIKIKMEVGEREYGGGKCQVGKVFREL